MEPTTITRLQIDVLQPNPLQPRGLITPESLVELVDSIREHGILEPIVVAKTPAGYQIIAGERRWRASRIAGLTEVPVVIKETTLQGMLELAIVENVQRVDLNALERAQAYRKLLDEFGLTNLEIAQRVGKSPAYVSNTIRLLSLPDAIKDGIMAGQTTEGHARALAALESDEEIIEAYKEVLRKNLSVRATEELTRKFKSGKGMEPKREVDRYHVSGMEEIEQQLAQDLSFGDVKAKAKIAQSRRRLKITLDIDGPSEQTGILLAKVQDAIARVKTGYDDVSLLQQTAVTTETVPLAEPPQQY